MHNIQDYIYNYSVYTTTTMNCNWLKAITKKKFIKKTQIWSNLVLILTPIKPKDKDLIGIRAQVLSNQGPMVFSTKLKISSLETLESNL